MRRFWLLPALVIGSACSDTAPEPVPETTQPAHLAGDALPVVLSYPTEIAMEALISGTLTRTGPCLYLDTGARRDLILWSDDVEAARLQKGDWLINDLTTGQHFREGDFLRGGGGQLPDNADLEELTPEEIPFECERGSAIQFHSVGEMPKPANAPGDLPAPPPAPPPPPSIISSVKKSPPASGFPEVTIHGIADVREALFAHVIGKYRQSDHFAGRSICLNDASDALVARLDSRFGQIQPDRACGWQKGGVILESTGESAFYVHAKVDCSGRECAAEGGATYGNLGGEGHGYRMRRKGNAWTLQKTGISWIS